MSTIFFLEKLALSNLSKVNTNNPNANIRMDSFNTPEDQISMEGIKKQAAIHSLGVFFTCFLAVLYIATKPINESKQKTSVCT